MKQHSVMKTNLCSPVIAYWQVLCRGLLVALAGVTTSIPLLATPPLDPICGSPSSQELVRAIRAERLAVQAGRGAIRLHGAEPPARLSIERAPVESGNWGLLTLQGAAGRTYELETTSNLVSSQWSSLLTFRMGDQGTSWWSVGDASPGGTPTEFFRLRSVPTDAPAETVSNFRLLDAQGISRDLFYHTHLAGIAVVAAGTNLAQIGPLAREIAQLAQLYVGRVETWILLSDPAPVRSNVLAQANALGLGEVSVLLDAHGLAARSMGLTRAGEVALIRAPDFTVAYRGPVDLFPNDPISQSLLEAAVGDLLSQSPVTTYLRMPAPGPQLAHTAEPTPEYARDIAPVLYDYCAKCHRPDSVAPFALTNYSVAAEWAPTIKHALLSNQMPPWHADPEHGRFANDLSLPGHLKSALVRWIDAGAPRGEGGDPLADLPPPPAYDRWPDELGEPDALVTIPVQPVKADGVEPYRYIFTYTPNPTNVWLRAAALRPSNYRAVHHALVWKGHIGNSGTMDNSTYRDHIAEFVPGFKPFQLPADAGIFLAASNRLTFNLHYTPYGVETNDQPVLALWYHKARPARTWVSTLGPANGSFSIPPQARDYSVQAEMTFSSPATLYRMNPHMHLRGKRVKYEAFYPNGKREVLLSVPDYDFNWQVGYALAEPKALPAGTRVVVSGAFDNSPQNLANPDPNARVTWGDQSWMEMFVGFLDYAQ